MIERILSHQQSKLLSNDEMIPVSAASICTWTTYSNSNPYENTVDIGNDY